MESSLQTLFFVDLTIVCEQIELKRAIVWSHIIRIDTEPAYQEPMVHLTIEGVEHCFRYYSGNIAGIP